MNMKFCDVDVTSEKGEVVIMKNRLTSVFHASVTLLKMNFVIPLLK